jgi:hypothetical protein
MEKLRISMFCALALALAAGPVGCGDDDGSTGDEQQDEDGGRAGHGGSGSSGHGGGSSGSGGTRDGGPADDGGEAGNGGSGEAGGGGTTDHACPDLADREEVFVDADIEEDTTWSCDKLYILGALVFVTDDSTLTIEPGTIVQGDEGSALLITRGSQLSAEGTVDAPIVFTSSADEGNRRSGDWGGVILMGGAPINIPAGENRIEGIDPTDDRGLYGGDDDASNCGSIKYTRIEFAGFELSIDNELNGLTLGGCGSDTTISYVQVHMGFDDGIEIFGGSPKLDHIVLTGNADDQFDTDLGFVGQVQFLVMQLNPDNINSSDPQGFEWDNNRDANDAEPRNAPTVFNATLVGTDEGIQSGLILRRGTWGILKNLIVMGFPVSAVDVRDMATAVGAEEDPPALAIDNSLFFDNGADGMSHFEEESGMTDDDMGFDEEAFFTDAARENVFDMDPELDDPFNVSAPNFVPASGSPAADGAATPPSGFDTSATYMGAFEPGGDDWTEGWTAYPAD